MNSTSSRSLTLSLGTVVISSLTLQAAKPEEIGTALARHASGDWGELTDEERCENEYDLLAGHAVRSVHRTEGGQAFWIVTIDNRSVTTVVLPDEV